MRRHNFGRIFRFLLVLLGNCLYALTVKLFLLPAGLISTGTTGARCRRVAASFMGCSRGVGRVRQRPSQAGPGPDG